MSEIEEQAIYQVSELNTSARMLLETSFQTIWVTGELSNLACPSSGHFYFSLKDARAQIKCALFKHSSRRLNFTPENGQHVLVQARVTLYEARGDFQLVIQQMQLAGDGALQLAFAQLKQKLAAEGLFDSAHKKPLPLFPRTIGVITSSTGAAIHDIIQVLKKRCHATAIIIYPTLVQGSQAATQIVQAIETANRRRECDVLLLARGGGSLEDLWPFNEEIVARAIYHSALPISSAIGHEIDFTIADFVADLRAPTPSAAAAMLTPSLAEWLKQFAEGYHRLHRQLNHHLQQANLMLYSLQQRLRHPKQQLQTYRRDLKSLCHRLITAEQNQFENQRTKFVALTQQLNTVSPLKTLERGYSIATLTHNNVILRDSQQTKPNDTVQLQLAKGKLLCRVV